MRRITWFAAAAVAGLLAVPAAASADNLPVQVGGEVAGKPWIDLQGVYPKKAVVHVGDTIDFSIVGFHTIAVLPNGTDALPIVAPTGGKFPATNDANGDPFWWGGAVDAFGLNGAVFTPSPTTTFDGTALVHSGGPAPLSVTFTAPGKFILACEVHPFMRGTVKVTAAGTEIRSFAKQVKKGAKELRKDAKKAQKLDKKLAKNRKHHGGGNARSHGHHGKKARNATVRTGAGTKRFSLLRFYPADATVKVGGSVTWKWTGFNEVHTVTIAPADVLDALDATLFGPCPARRPTRSAPCPPRRPAPPSCTPIRCTAMACSAPGSSPTRAAGRRIRSRPSSPARACSPTSA